MTTAEKLAFVEAQIRKDIPRTMELREGLVFQFEDRILKVLYKYDETRWKCVDTFGVQGKFPDEVINKKSKIIGHDIMLNDVLEWLQSLNIQIEIQCYSEENTIGFYYVRIDKNCDVHEEMEIWNLSPPTSKTSQKN